MTQGEFNFQVSWISNDMIDFRATCEELLKEYKACESPDYISYASTIKLKSFCY